MRSLFFIPMLFCCLALNGQVTFEKTYSFSSGSSIQQLANGNYIGCGDSVTYGYVYKLDRFGNLIWSHLPLVRNNYVSINDITTNPLTGGYAICGYSNDISGSGATGYYMLIDSLFNNIDSILFTGGTIGPTVQTIQRTPGNDFVVGIEELNNTGSDSSNGRKVNYPSTQSWIAPTGTNITENCLAIDSSGNMIITGFDWINPTLVNAYLYDNAGTLQQAFSVTDTIYSGASVNQSVVAPAPNGNNMFGVELTPYSGYNILPYIAQLDDSLHIVWDKYIEWNINLTLNAIIPTKDSCILLLLSTDNGIALHKLSSTGDSLWTQYHNRLNVTYGRRIRQCADLGFIITGDYSDTISNYGYVLKTDSLGRLLPPTQLTVSGPTTFCPGDSVQLSVPSGYHYLWSNGDTTNSIWAKQAQNYWVKVTGDDSLFAYSDTVHVTLYTVQTPVISNVSNVLHSTGTGTFQWYFYGNPIAGATSSNFTPVNNGEYTVRLTNNNGCKKFSSIYTVTFIPTSHIQVIGSTQICPGDSVRLLAPTGIQFHWSTGATTNLIWVKQVQSYWVTVTDSNSFVFNSDTVHITFFNTQTPVVSNNNNLLSSTGTGTFKWYRNGVLIPGATSSSYLATQSGNYTVSLTDVNGCTVISAPYNLFYIPTYIQVNGSLGICPGDSVQLSAASGFQYLWSTGETTASIWVSQAQSYWATISDGGSHSVHSDTVTINIFSTQTPVISVSSNVLSSTGTGTLQWYFYGNAIAGADSSTHTPLNNGEYSVMLTDNNGCIVTSSVFTVNFIPTSSLQVIGSNQICPGDSVRILAPPGISYLWSTGDTANLIWASQVQNYWATVTDSNSFSYNTDTVSISLYNLQTPVISNTINLLTTSGVGTYQWYYNSNIINGATASSYAATLNGDYTVLLTDSNGCMVLSAPFSFIFNSVSDIADAIRVSETESSIIINSSVTMKNVAVFDISGRTLMNNYYGKKVVNIDKIRFSKGIYIISVVTSSGERWNRRFVN